MRFLIAVTCALAVLASCKEHHSDERVQETIRRTVLVYIAGDNDLKTEIATDISQMMAGSKSMSKNDRLVLFVDKNGQIPYFLEVTDGDTIRIETLDGERDTASPATLREAMMWTINHYEAESYGLVLWGHAEGWIVKHLAAASRGQRRAYGYDATGTNNWMEIADMASVLQSLPVKPLFIFADCCCFQSVESAYELRNCTDYIIGSPAEIPAVGAPYQTVVPALFSQDSTFYKEVVDAYYEQTVTQMKEPLSVIKTERMDDLAAATRTTLHSCITPMSDSLRTYPDVDSLIYYYDHTLFDMNDFVMRHAGAEQYEEWRRTFDEVVVCSAFADVWVANHISKRTQINKVYFTDFTVTEERYGGVSMFVPQPVSNGRSMTEQLQIYNQSQTINKMQWYSAAGLDQLGW